MTLRRDHLVIVDVESTCWQNHHSPPNESTEIIEIGICLLDLTTLERSQRRSILVKPIHSKVSPFCTQLTSLTQEQVEGGISFAEACQILETDYLTPERWWGSWGYYDRRMFEQQCRRRALNYPFSSQHINIKTRFAECQNAKQMGMERALIHIGIKPEGRAHRGVDDAWNLAGIMAHLLKTCGGNLLKEE